MVATPSRSSTPASGNRRDSIQPARDSPSSTSVQVVVRIRPNSGSDLSNGPPRFRRTCILPVSSTTLQVDSSTPSPIPSTNRFTFDRVINEQEGQPDVYAEVEPLVESFLEGMNCTILAYGQTSSGKSYTMGTDRMSEEDDEMGEERVGVTGRAVSDIFRRMEDAERRTKGTSTFAAKLSYVELHHEDLIDLLVGDVDFKPAVTIREDKAGNIVWSGLREVKVTSAQEVMNHLTAGSALRQTNATEMNAQSSRSHAIFSLTLTQRKYTGSGAPPTLPPAASRLNRASVFLPQLSVPSSPSSRSQTPTNERPGSRIGRPSSVMGRPGMPLLEEGTEKTGTDSWVTITSKFHFVDLAGSERLKRTAAQGERVKEGISINSGLHALGNVISALGDPARARQTTHIPYRDSKLTRLLQDSLGGNAQTMMIACVSPAEYNLTETLSTLKYANRAKNIKNRAEVNEVEVGWDDVSYLQSTITALRAEMSALRSNDGSSVHPVVEEGHKNANGNGNGTTRELQDKYSDLTQRFAQLTAELARSQAGAAASHSSLSREDFANAVEPIVEEYEKSLSALEGQLALTKAALGHSEEEMRDLEDKCEETARAAEESGVMVGELKSRIAKLAEREATTEAYVRDLEGKLHDYGEQDLSHGSAVSDLRKEITKRREESETTEKYLRELEGRLASSEDASVVLQSQIEVLERDIQRREAAYVDLEGRLSLLDTSGEHKVLLAEIDERDRRLLDLERSYDDLKSKATSAENEARRLESIARKEKSAKHELRSRVQTLERASLIAEGNFATHSRRTTYTPPQTPADEGSPRMDSLSDDDPAPTAGLELQLRHLQATYDETLVALEAANAKYRNSLREIEELKLVHSENGDFVPSPSSPNFPASTFLPRSTSIDGIDELNSPVTRPSALTLTTPPANRTPRSRRSMPLAPQHRLSFLGRGGGQLTPSSHPPSASLSSELSSAQAQRSSSPPSPTSGSPPSRRESRADSLSSGGGDRSYEQLKEEVVKLQQALTDREEEISSLEASLHRMDKTPIDTGSSQARSIPSGMVTPPRTASLISDPLDMHFSPKTLATFSALKADLSSTSSAMTTRDEDDNATRLDDLMRSMARKESGHREAIEGLEDQLSSLRRSHEDLTAVSRDQVVNMSSEIERLRLLLEGRPEPSHYETRLDSMQSELDAKTLEVDTVRSTSASELASTTSDLSAQHTRSFDALAVSHASLLSQAKEENLQIYQYTLRGHEDALTKKETEHETVVRDLTSRHLDMVDQQGVDHSSAMEEARTTHEETIKSLEKQHSTLVLSRDAEYTSTLVQLNDEHITALEQCKTESSVAMEKLDVEHDEVIKTRDAGHSTAISSLRDDHSAALAVVLASHSLAIDGLRADHERATLSQLEEHAVVVAGHTAALDELRQDHEQKSRSLADDHASAIAALQAHHSSSNSTAEDVASATHSTQLDALRQQQDAALSSQSSIHSDAIAAVTERHQVELAASVELVKTEHAQALEKIVAAHDQRTQELVEAHKAALVDLQATHDRTLVALQDSHDSLALITASHARDLEGLATAHAEQTRDLVTLHAAALGELQTTHNGTLVALQDSHDQIAALKTSHVQALDTLAATHDERTRKLVDSHAAQQQEMLATHNKTLVDLCQTHESMLLAERDAHAASLGEQAQNGSTEYDASRRALLVSHSTSMADLTDQHTASLASLAAEHTAALSSIKDGHSRTLADQLDSHAATFSELKTSHQQQLASLTTERDAAHASAQDLAATHDVLTSEKAQLATQLESTRSEHADLVQRFDALSGQHTALASAHEVQLVALQSTLATAVASHASTRDEKVALQSEHQEALDALSTLEKSLLDSQLEREQLLESLQQLRVAKEESKTKLDNLVKENETQRVSLAHIDEDLFRTRKERDLLSVRLAHDTAAGYLSSSSLLSLGNTAGSPNISHYESATSTRSLTPDADEEVLAPSREFRAVSPTTSLLINGAPISTLPPTPPPSMPPPALPPSTSMQSMSSRTARSASISSNPASLVTSRMSTGIESTAATSVRTASVADLAMLDPRITKRFEDQDAQIDRLTKQLQHCESDLHANLDLVSTLESALNDSERNLRKSRTMMNDLAKERDSFHAQNDALRQEIHEANSEVETVRYSVLQVETRLQEERNGKDRAKAELERRLEDVNKRKNKFACF